MQSELTVRTLLVDRYRILHLVAWLDANLRSKLPEMRASMKISTKCKCLLNPASTESLCSECQVDSIRKFGRELLVEDETCSCSA